MKVRYFAWVRERVGKAEEDIDPPDGIATVGDLVAWLTHRGEGYAYAFENPNVVRSAIDKRHVRADARIAGERNRIFPADDRRLRLRSWPSPKGRTATVHQLFIELRGRRWQSADQRPMTDEQKSRFAALQGAWLAVREKRRRAEMAAELDAAIMEFLKLHRAETDTVVLQAFQRWVRGAA